MLPFDYPPQNIPQQIPNVRKRAITYTIVSMCFPLFICQILSISSLSLKPLRDYLLFLFFRFPHLMPILSRPRIPCSLSSRTSPHRQARFLSIYTSHLVYSSLTRVVLQINAYVVWNVSHLPVIFSFADAGEGVKWLRCTWSNIYFSLTFRHLQLVK